MKQVLNLANQTKTNPEYIMPQQLSKQKVLF